MENHVPKTREKKKHQQSKNTHSDNLEHKNSLALDVPYQFSTLSPSALRKSKNVRSRLHQLSPLNEDGINDCVFNIHRLPQDLVEDILIQLDPDELKMARFVCKTWREMIENYVFKKKAMREAVYSFSECSEKEKTELSLPWWLYYSICLYDPFNRNLLRNNCGQEGMNYWSETQCVSWSRFTHWIQESPPCDCDPLPDSPDFGGCTCCFTTHCGGCNRLQVIRFSEEGLWNKIMDDYKPEIIVSQWYTSTQSEYYYTLHAYLQDNENIIIREDTEEKSSPPFISGKWFKAERILKEYGPGARKIAFYVIGHGERWEFHYDCKMSGEVVKVCLPKNFSVKQYRGQDEEDD